MLMTLTKLSHIWSAPSQVNGDKMPIEYYIRNFACERRRYRSNEIDKPLNLPTLGVREEIGQGCVSGEWSIS